MSQLDDLPSFRLPPITEVALSVQFNELQGMQFIHLGRLYEKFQSNFPQIQEQSPIGAAFELFGGAPAALPSIKFQTTPPMPRVIFMNAAGTELIQFQIDRFIHNWRRTDQNKKYPRYEQVKAAFEAEFEQLSSFVLEQKLSPLVPNQCEVIYVNQIEHSDIIAGRFGEVFNIWNDSSDASIGSTESATFNARFIIHDSNGAPVGRLIAEAATGVDIATGKPIIQLMLTARGRPNTPDKEGVFHFFDIARDKIVRGFAALTTKKMHAIWEREI
jgi:uncharacterized protein (TIGR04255 family)